MQRIQFIKTYLLWIILLIVIVVRLFHLEDQIDAPHAWRQYDTKQYIDSYLYHDAAFLEPEVCWMGGHKKLALEFPFPEFLAAKVQVVFGENLFVLRLFFLFFFALSSFFLYKIVLFYSDEWSAALLVLFFGFAPLSVYFSRAIHIDFFALSFAFGMLFYAMKAIKNASFLLLLISMCFASVVFLVKVPYAFYLALPILVFALQQKKLLWLLKRGVVFLIPVVLMFWWVRYAGSLNSKAPDWDFIPNYNKFTDMWYWYFGTWGQRMNWENWSLIFGRIYNEILGLPGLVLFVLGIVLSKKDALYWFSFSWLLGTLVYLLIFFNLNVIHDYYQMPFIAAVMLYVVFGIKTMLSLSSSSVVKVSMSLVVVSIFATESIRFSEANFYNVNEDFNEVATLIRENSNPDDIVVVSYGGLSPQCPLILQPANRFGFSVPVNDLTAKLAYKLGDEAGATKLAIVYGGYFDGEFRNFFEAMENKKGFDISNGKEALYMCDLVFRKPE